MKIQAHGKKMRQFRPDDARLATIVEQAGLSPLLHCCYDQLDGGLLGALVERWHPETSSFHLPVGEMTITLDDVVSLTHLKTDGVFFSPASLRSEDAWPHLRDLLGMTEYDAKKEVFTECKGPSVRFDTLTAICEARLPPVPVDGDAAVSEEDAVGLLIAGRAYLMRFLGLLMFPDKSGNKVLASYLLVVDTQDLSRVSRFAWARVLLAYLYLQLGESCQHRCRQFTGPLWLLQVHLS